MKYLQIPTTIEDMTISLSMTGVTILTQGKFKVRHHGMKDIVQRVDTGFVHRSTEPTPKNRRPSKSAAPKAPGQSRQYRIDKKQVSHRIRGYLNQMKGEKMLYFWTITFPLNTPDDTCYILLNKWLTRLRQEKMLREYLWIAERQENGTIHFHMVINQKMNVQRANKFMRASIMHSINKGEVNYSREAAIKYNGVDIAKDRKTRRVINFAKQNKQKSLANYLTKYVTKNNNTFSHLAWHSSRGYSNLITAVRFTYSEYQKGNCEQLLDHDKELKAEYFTFKRWKGSPPKDLLMYLGLLNSEIQQRFKN